MFVSAPSKLIGTAAVAAVIATVLTLVIGPNPPERLRQASGDAKLAERLQDALSDGDGIRTAAVALIDDGGNRVTYAGLDQPGGTVDEHTRFEIGSVTKGLTGMLLADAAEQGEVSLDASLDSFTPGLGAATLTDLSTHHSGLPRLPGDLIFVARLLGSNLSGGHPYSSTPEKVIGQARSAAAPGGGEFAYSNLGVATLGQVLANALGTSYSQALSERVLRPLGMVETTVVTQRNQLPANRATGSQSNGRRTAEWIGDGYAPAGVGVWSTTSDLSRLVAALLRSQAPGNSAVRPRAETGQAGERVGLGWFASTVGDRSIVWHNGGTGGFSSFVGFDVEAGRGIVILAATNRHVDEAAHRLLAGDNG